MDLFDKVLDKQCSTFKVIYKIIIGIYIYVVIY